MSEEGKSEESNLYAAPEANVIVKQDPEEIRDIYFANVYNDMYQ